MTIKALTPKTGKYKSYKNVKSWLGEWGVTS